MKIRISTLLIALWFTSPPVFGDVKDLYTRKCASCHGKDGSGGTAMGKRSGAKDYRDAKVQASFSDAEGLKAIKDGVTQDGNEKMKAYGAKISEADCKALMDYIRAFKK